MGDYTCEITTSNHHHFKTKIKRKKSWLTTDAKFGDFNDLLALIVLAYTDIGLILLYVTTYPADQTYFVANLISKQRITIPTPPTSLLGFETEEPWFREVLSFVESDALFRQAGLVTRTKDETGLWSKILHSPLPLISLNLLEPVTLSWNLHWFGLNLDGSLMYMNIFSESVHHKLVVWRLMNREWQLVSVLMGFDYLPLTLAINPFDGNTIVHVESDARFFGIY
ncbi:hypothetical protein YC2023_025342 [Brassica napus]